MSADTWRDRLRAQIVLAAARGHPNGRIAAGLGITVDTVRKWRRRFAVRGLDGLADRPRPGRPRRVSAADRAAVVALACQLPAVTGVPLGRQSGPELAAELAARGLASPMSASSVLRILAEHPVKPWQYQSWIYPRDPDSEARAKVIADLYQGYYQGEPLGPGDRILSFDARPQINARRHPHPTLPAAPGRPVRYEHEYRRQGSLALLARPGRAHRAGVRLHPAHHRDQAVHGPGRAGHSPPGVQGRGPGLRHRRQRLGSPRPGRHQPAGPGAPERDHDPHPGARVLAEPDRGSSSPSSRRKSSPQTTSTASGSYPGPCWASRTATTRPPGRSAGSSPPATCTASWPASAATSSSTTFRTNRYRRPHDNPRRTSGATHLSPGHGGDHELTEGAAADPWR